MQVLYRCTSHLIITIIIIIIIITATIQKRCKPLCIFLIVLYVIYKLKMLTESN